MKKKEELFEKYKLLVAARNFHYENFNKWMTYFYVANGAIFLGYINLLTNSASHSITIELGILFLGYVAGLLLYWSSKGYYHWNINFITLVNHYESNILNWKREERIYSVHGNKNRQNNYLSPVSGANISTSKIAILFAFIITISWGTILVFEIPKILSCWNFSFHLNCCNKILWLFISIVISAFLTSFFGLIVREGGRSFIASNFEPLIDLELNQKD